MAQKAKTKTKTPIKAKVNTKKASFEEYVEGRFRFLGQELFMLSFINISFIHNHEQEKNNFGNVVFRINYISPYHQALITTFKMARDMYEIDDLTTLDRAIVHELCHIHTAKIVDVANNRFVTENELSDANEELTETMAQYVLTIKKLKNIK